ncbi:MAG TPA: hypothetical protein VN181_09570 [Thermoanaerobaculia bacterium]|nr:hypothetical protein [Thermoanaerobaculia bacterium]
MTELLQQAAVWALVLGFAAAAPSSADVGSMSVSPSEVMLRGRVGQTTTQTLSFTNKTSRALSFEMMAQDAVVLDGTRSYVEAGTIPASIAATAVFSPKVFTAASGESVDIRVTVTIPPNPAVRAIAVMCQGTTKLGVVPLQMTASVGTLFTFALAGDVIAATASPLLVQTPTASSYFAAGQQVVNSGTEPVVATGMLVILDESGVMIGRQVIPGWRMLPGEKTPVRVVYDGRLVAGHYRAMITYDLTDKTLTSVAEFDVQ